MRILSTLLSFVFLLIAGSAISQTALVKGQLIDSVSKQNLKDATVSVLNPADSSLLVYGLTKADGGFSLPNVPFGSHIMYITFQGYVEIEKRFTVSAEVKEFDAGKLYMVALPRNLGNVTVRTSPITIKGDTTEFTASQFATKPNSTAEDLLKKMPGMEVEKDGSIKAQGQTVTRIMVDGKRFFGDDPTLATRNLPTDMIDKIQVIDAQSDQSAFSGFDDGNRQTTINIITKKDRRKGVFGKVVLGGGNDLNLTDSYRYLGNVNLSVFNGNRQISFIGQSNNNNNQNFSAQDILGGGGGQVSAAPGGGGGQRGGQGGGGGGFQGGGQRGGGGGGAPMGGGFSTGPTGFTKTLAGGLNYSDVWSPKTNVNGSYFYNNQNRITNTDRLTENFVPGDASRFTASNSYTNNKNSNNRFNFEIEHRIDTNNLIRIRPYFTQQQTNNFSQSSSSTTAGKTTPLNDALITNNTESNGYNFNNNILLQHRFAKRGRTLSLNLTQALSTNESIRKTLNINSSYNNGILRKDTVDQISNTERDTKSFGGTISYTEPVGTKGRLELNYYHNTNENNSDQKTSIFNKKTGQYDSVDIRQSNNLESDIKDNRLSLNYQRQINTLFNYTVGLGVQNSDRTVNNLTLKTLTKQSLNNFTPTFQLQYRKDRSLNIRFNYRGATQQPDVSQLQEVIDESNRLRITTGNPNLKQSFSNNINLMMSKFDPVTFKNIVVSVNGSITMNSIGSQIFQNNDVVSVTLDNGVNLLPNAQFVRPINRNGGYNMGGFFNYGFPIKRPKSNVNLSTNVNYTRSVNTITSVTRSNNALAGASAPSFTNNYVLGQTVRFTMNVKDRLDLNFSSRSTYNMAQYSEMVKGVNQTTNNNFFTEVVSVEPTYSTKGGFIISNDFDYNLSRGQAEGYNQSFAMWNASIAQLLFKKKQGEIRFTVYDMLNQNRSITRTIQQNYIEDVKTDVLRRYFMLTFTYNIRKFGGSTPPANGGDRQNMFRGGGSGGFGEGMRGMRPPNN